MRVLLDYRPALRERSGVGEYADQIVRALMAATSRDGAGSLDLTLFSSSWKDRLVTTPDIAGIRSVDRRVPVSLLNFAWHRLGWPPAELLARQTVDVTHSLHPLIMPSRAAARVITIHDLHFLTHPERARAEIRRDYAPLARAHAHRADAIIVVSEFTAREVERRLEVPIDRVVVCRPGAPPWEPRAAVSMNGYVLFMGTLEPRKNVGGLLDAYEQLTSRRDDVPKLLVAGRVIGESKPLLERITQPPLAGRVEHIGYVDPAKRRSVYEGARLLVQPSFEEGFGMPVLEAMTLGVPVVASDRGALPEVLGDAGALVDPDQPAALAAAIERVIDDEAFAATCAAKGVARSHQFSWDATAKQILRAYDLAIERRCASA